MSYLAKTGFKQVHCDMNHNWVNCCRSIFQHIHILLSDSEYREKFTMLIIQKILFSYYQRYVSAKRCELIIKHIMEVSMKFSKMNSKFIFMISRIVRVNKATMFSKDI